MNGSVVQRIKQCLGDVEPLATNYEQLRIRLRRSLTVLTQRHNIWRIQQNRSLPPSATRGSTRILGLVAWPLASPITPLVSRNSRRLPFALPAHILIGTGLSEPCMLKGYTASSAAEAQPCSPVPMSAYANWSNRASGRMPWIRGQRDSNGNCRMRVTWR